MIPHGLHLEGCDRCDGREREKERERVIGNKMFLLKGFAGNSTLWIGIEWNFKGDNGLNMIFRKLNENFVWRY